MSKRQSQNKTEPKKRGNEGELRKKVKEDYSSLSYWDDRYSIGKDIQEGFEWFLSYSDIEPILKSILNFSDRTAIFIDLGCGTSCFLRDLKTNGYKGPLLGYDYSSVAIEKMQARKDCKGIDFRVCDAVKISDSVKGASTILDKSLMDTLLHLKDKEVVPNMLKAIARSLKPDGYYISITQLDPRKPEDLKFLQDVVLKNLSDEKQTLCSVTAHVTSIEEGSKPVPSVFIYQYGPNKNAENIEVEIVEYEASEEENSD